MLAAHVMEARHVGDLFAEMARENDGPKMMVFLMKCAQGAHCIVVASVIDVDHLIRLTRFGQYGGELAMKIGDRVLLIVEGDNDRHIAGMGTFFRGHGAEYTTLRRVHAEWACLTLDCFPRITVGFVKDSLAVFPGERRTVLQRTFNLGEVSEAESVLFVARDYV